VFLEGLPPDTVLQIQTQHHSYTALLLGEGVALISGHPEYCPDPVQVTIAGSTWGGSMLKVRFIGRGMRLEFHHPGYATPIVTSTDSRDSRADSLRQQTAHWAGDGRRLKKGRFTVPVAGYFPLTTHFYYYVPSPSSAASPLLRLGRRSHCGFGLMGARLA